jgi:hypothetical protein
MRHGSQDEIERVPTGLEPDPSFQALLGELAWRRLPPAVRERFAWKPAPGAQIRYRGVMAVVRRSTIGALMAQLCRLIGTPLAPYGGYDVPVTVILRSDHKSTVWDRFYDFSGRTLVHCASIKRVSGRDGLLECVGGGLGMWLALSERQGELHFCSSGYFWECGRFRLRLPSWLTPGALHVVHADLGAGRFRFRIVVRHRLLGETFFQDGIFAADNEVSHGTRSVSDADMAAAASERSA